MAENTEQGVQESTEPQGTEETAPPEQESQQGEQQEGQESHDTGTDWKAEARKWETRAKENRAAVQERDALQEQLTQMQERVSAFEAQQERAGWARAAAADAGVPADLVRGETQEEMVAHANALREALATRGPVVMSQGKTGKVDVTDPKINAVRGLFGGKD